METTITKKTAKLAKEKGFDYSVHKYYKRHEKMKDFQLTNSKYYAEKESNFYFETKAIKNNIIAAPSQSVLANWLRKENNIDVFLDSVGGKNGYFYVLQDVLTGNQIKTGDKYNTFESSFEEGLFEALNLII